MHEPDKADLFFKICRGGVCRFEVAVTDLFSVKEGSKTAAVSVSGEHLLQWEGRALSEQEIRDLRRGIELIHIRGTPKIARRLTGESYRLEINGQDVFASYEWWGELPTPWSSLKTLIEVLRGLAIKAG